MGIDMHLYALEDEQQYQCVNDSDGSVLYTYKNRPERGYLRESYNAEYYATKDLAPWTWHNWRHPGWASPSDNDDVKYPDNRHEEWPEGIYIVWKEEEEEIVSNNGDVQIVKQHYRDGVVIPAKILRENLHHALVTAELRYDEDEYTKNHKEALIAFVEAAEQIEKEGKTPIIYNSY